MSNVEFVRRVVATVEEEGLQGLDLHFDELCRPDLEWRPRIVGAGKETYFGREGYREYLRDVVEQVSEISFTLGDVRPVDEDHVLVLGRLHIANREGGDPIDSEYAMLFRIEDDLIRSCVAFASHAEALEAADLA
jgi:ketosteroid isomerase-like protein